MEKEFKFGINANVLVELLDINGKVVDSREIHNALTNAGKYGIMDQILASPALAKMGWMELGSGIGGTTALNSYIVGSRVAFTSKTRLNNVITVVGDFPVGTGTGTITEAGTFDAVTENGGNMWMYASFSAITKPADLSLKITWTLTAS